MFIDAFPTLHNDDLVDEKVIHGVTFKTIDHKKVADRNETLTRQNIAREKDRANGIKAKQEAGA